MFGRSHNLPGSMPVLSKGRHRRPRRGACLMEYVSVLAGERFSDAPACTDPVLTVVARCVNDYSGDLRRQRLALLASDLTCAGPADLEVQQAVTRRCLLTALRVASGERRRTLIVALLGLDRAAAGRATGFSSADVSIDAEFGLMGCTSDVAVAQRHVASLPVAPDQLHRKGIGTAIEMAVATIATETTHGDDMLYDLLVACLGDVRVTEVQRPVPAPSREQLR
jgi:hypothetical protein